jgi:predicted permease
VLEDLSFDLRYAIRAWLRAPAFAVTAILTIAFGIGANTAIFSLLDALLLRPLPVQDPYRLVRIGSLEGNGMTVPVPGPLLDDLRKDPLIEGVCGLQTPVSNITLKGATFPAGTHALTSDCYRTLGIHAAIGRLLAASDDIPNSPRVAVLSFAFWRDKFAGNPNVLGQTIRIEGEPFTIVGVTEPGFRGLLLGFPPSVSFPISKMGGDPSRASVFYWADVLARLKPGVSPQMVRAKLASEWRRLLDSSLPARFRDAQRAEILSQPVLVTSGANGLDYSLRNRFRQPLAGLLAISALVLLVACMNVANLVLARGMERRREIAVRLALGAKRGRIARQLIAESVLLILGGFGAALLLGSVCDHLLLNALSMFYTDLWIDAGLNLRVLAFTAGSALVALLLFGVLPAWQSSDIDSAAALKTASRSVSGGRAPTRRLLISGQVALTMVLILGASLFIETLRNLRREPLGFETHAILDAQLTPLPGGVLKGPAASAYLTLLLDRVRKIPGVDDASLSTFFPLLTLPYPEDVRRLDAPDRPVLQASAQFVSDGFLRTLRIPLLEGRDFRRTGDSQKTAIVSQTLARRLFPEGSALGRHIRFGSETETLNLEIVGVARDARLDDPRGKQLSFLYLNLWERPLGGNWGNLQVRSSAPEAQVVAAVRAELQKGGHQYTFQIRSLAAQHERSLLQEKLLAALGTSFGVLGLALAAVGLFGLLSFFVATRQGEIGLRMALGAERRYICWLVIREAGILVGTGVLIGLPLCYFVGRGLAGLVHGIAPVPVVSLLFSSAILLLVAATATLVPVYRASSVDPVIALRHE